MPPPSSSSSSSSSLSRAPSTPLSSSASTITPSTTRPPLRVGPRSTLGPEEEIDPLTGAPLKRRIPVTPGVLRAIFASSRSALEERSISRLAFFRNDSNGGPILPSPSALASPTSPPPLASFALPTDPPPTYEEADPNPLAVARPIPPDLLLVIFIHGFKGDDETFGSFPARLQHILAASITNVVVECIVFPQYETKGVLREAVDRFADWLVTLTVEREVAHGTGGGAGKARIVLCGHSMGGLLAADTLLQLYDTRPDKAAPLWPRVIALIAYDTPYLGIHPLVFQSQATQAGEFLKAGYGIWQAFSSPTGSGSSTPVGAPQPSATAAAQAAASLASASGGTGGGAPLPVPAQPLWARLAAPAAYALGSALVAGVLGTAYARRTEIADAYGWVQSHLRYVGHLWERAALVQRVRRIADVGDEMGVRFRAYYTLVDPRAPAFPTERTFCVLPQTEADGKRFWLPARNRFADSEIGAHMGMFEGKTNDGYYQLGLDTAGLIREAVMVRRGVYDVEQPVEVEEHA